MLVLPFAEFPFFTEEVTLDGVTYRLAFLWNTRASLWTVSFYDTTEAPIAEGLPITLDQEILGQYPTLGLPPGRLWAVDPSDTLHTIGRDDIAKGLVQIIYTPAAEVV
jgi:hypothetical protein